jgi:Helicase associated domain
MKLELQYLSANSKMEDEADTKSAKRLTEKRSVQALPVVLRDASTSGDAVEQGVKQNSEDARVVDVTFSIKRQKTTLLTDVGSLKGKDEEGSRFGPEATIDTQAKDIASLSKSEEITAAMDPSTASTTKSTKIVLPPIPHSAGQTVHLDPTNPIHFDHFLFQLLMFKSENNTFAVPKEDYPDLHAWLQQVKKLYKTFSSFADGPNAGSLRRGIPLTVAQIKVLEHLHVPLTTRGSDHWNRFYDLLWQYKDRHGHVLVPRLCEVPGLGDWVTDQRRQYKAMKQGQPSQMTKERRDKLLGLGFAFQVRNRPEWDARYSELVVYKEKYGDCKVPQHFKENKALGKWVAKQREQYKIMHRGQHSFLTPYRKEKLDSIGFVWQIRSSMDDNSDSDASVTKQQSPNKLPKTTATTITATVNNTIPNSRSSTTSMENREKGETQQSTRSLKANANDDIKSDLNYLVSSTIMSPNTTSLDKPCVEKFRDTVTTLRLENDVCDVSEV